MNPLAGWLLYNTAAAAVLALAVAAVQRSTKAPPALLHALWWLVLLQLCWPVRVLVPLWPAAPAPTAPIAIVADAAAARAATDVAVVPAAANDPVLPALPVAPAVSPAGSPAAATPGPDVLALAWLAGSFAVALWLSVAVTRAHRRRLRLPPAPQWLAAEVAALCSQLGIRSPLLRDDPAAATPYVWPFGRPCVVAGAAALQAMLPAVRTAVLAHELAHLRRGDRIWLWLECALAAALFWHPLFWFARARAREQAELACDAWAIHLAPAARLGYARALVDALDTAHPAPALPVLASRPAARRAFERRLAMVLQRSVPWRLSKWAGAGVAVLAAAAAVVPVRAQERAAERAAERDRPRIEIRIDGVPIESLDARQRERVLRGLGLEGEALRLALQARSLDAAAAQEPKPAPAPAPARAPAARERAPRGRLQPRQDDRRVADEPAAPGTDVGAVVREALAEARKELATDSDLRELGITDDVLSVLDAIEAGRDFGGPLQNVIDQAIAGAGRMARREIAADPDLKKLGIADDLAGLVDGLLQNKDVQAGLGTLAKKAMHQALAEVRAELAADPDLKALGIDRELQKMFDGLEQGRLDLDGLTPLIQKAIDGAMRQVHRAGARDDRDERDERDEEKPASAPREQRRGRTGR